MLTVVLTILADGGSGRRCQVTVGNKEIYLEDVEALEFLRKKRGRREQRGGGQTETDDRDRARTKSLLVLNSFFVETFTSEWQTSQECRWEEEEEDEGLLFTCTQC